MINTLKHLAYILQVDFKELESICSLQDLSQFYYEKKEFKYNSKGEKKLDGKNQPILRIINPSKGKLKIIQKKIDKLIFKSIPLPYYCFGAVSGKDNIKNAIQHKGKKHKFLTDMKDFFPLITSKMVFDMFRRLNFSPTVSHALTRLTTYKGHIPQGAPTSSSLANFVFVNTGNKLAKLAEQNNLTFTTFVDDITMSSPDDFKELVPSIIEIIESGGFKINHKKTYYKTKDPIITGVIANQNEIKLSSDTLMRLKREEGRNKNQINGSLRYIDRVNNINQGRD